MRRQNRQLSMQTIPLPQDAIAERYISAGWLLSQMDLAAGKRADDHAQSRAVTVAVDSMSFTKPVYVGDQVTIYTKVVKQGRSAVTLKVESWAHRRRTKKNEKVTEGLFTFVAIDENHRAVPIKTRRPAGAAVATFKKRQKAAPVSTRPPAMSKLMLRTIPVPRDANYLGDIFGGWILEHMDLACAKAAEKHAGHRVATVGLEAMIFHKPVHIGDVVSFYTDIVRTGKTSVTVRVETWSTRRLSGELQKVTEGSFTYVALDENRNPVRIRPQP